MASYLCDTGVTVYDLIFDGDTQLIKTLSFTWFLSYQIWQLYV